MKKLIKLERRRNKLKHYIWISLKIFIFTLSMGVFFIALLIIDPRKSSTDKIKDSNGTVLPNSIAEIVKIDIDNTSQHLLIRGHDISNPIILFVHGGPGQAEIGYMKDYQAELEKHFIVVRWDQRGAGLSGSKDIPTESFTVDTFTSDVIEVTDYLIEKFHQPKIFISGHSWGTVISTYAIDRCPEKYFAYIGVSQVVDMQEAIKLAYQHSYTEAKKQNNNTVIKKLDAIGAPPYTINEFFTHNEIVGRMGGFVKTELPKSMVTSLFSSKEYTFAESLKYYMNLMHSGKLMYPEVVNINLFDEIKQVEVPIIFISGKHDYSTPISLVEKFYNNLDAPQKEFITFENSAHMPQLEENKRFNDIIINIKNTYGEQN